MKRITIILIILIILLLATLTFIGINVSKNTKPYKTLEKNIVNAMKVYYGQDTNLTKLPSEGKTHKVTLSELKSFGLNIENKINNDTCDGYGIVTGKLGSYTYKAYIKCSNYTSKNYENK